MYNSETVKQNFTGLIGWRQPETGDPIGTGLTASTSGQYYQSFHPMLTIENLRAIAPAGADFDTWLGRKTGDSILTAIRRFWDLKMSTGTAKNVLESRPLYDAAGRFEAIEPEADLVGFEITPAREQGVTLIIDRVGLNILGVTGTVNIYVFHSSRRSPVYTIPLNRSAGGVSWTDANIRLPFYDDGDRSRDAGGTWYVVYDQIALGTARAIGSNYDWGKKPPGFTEFNSAYIRPKWSRFLEVNPFCFKKTGSFAPFLWDVGENIYLDSGTWGMNLQISVECDATELLRKHRTAFVNLIGLQTAHDLLREMAFNPNFNIGRQQQNFDRGLILYELNGDGQSQHKTGLANDLKKALKAVSIDASAYSKICFPCGGKGLKYKGV